MDRIKYIEALSSKKLAIMQPW
uniref:Uncharacterized protein n=1 Tax=Anguilla anguilla TaxID=7936 RepID=A0A0E9XYS3_ANGAN